MNLGTGFQIGASGLKAGQGAMHTAGHNMANAMTPGYRRQRIGMLPISGVPHLGIGHSGHGVRVSGLSRAIDMALLARLRHARADEAASLTAQQRFGTIEDLLASVAPGGVAGAVESFIDAWGSVAEAPSDPAIRGVIVQQGVGLAKQIRTLRQQLVQQRQEIDQSLQDAVNKVNQLLSSIEALSSQIAAAEAAGGAAPSLRDSRDLLVDELSTLLDLAVVDRPDGSLDLLIGSTPIMLSGTSLGVTLVQTAAGTGVATVTDGAPLVAGGAIGALLASRAEGVQTEIARLDELAQRLMQAVNRIHVAGRGLHGRTSMTSFLGIENAAIPIAQNPLPSPVTAGVIRIQFGPAGSENPSVIEIQVDPAVDSLQQIAALITGAAGSPIATVNGQNQLVIEVPPGETFSILEDQTGLFTAIQFGAFFTGLSAADIDVDAALVNDPLLLSVALGEDDTAVAAAMLKLRTTTIDALNATLGDWWRLGDASLSARVAALSSGAEAAAIVRLGLQSQEQAISGVNLDEEAMNLIAAQGQYEAAARYISALQQALDTLLRMAAR
ncbi:MAG: flagellar hook-associated protein FlgK [Phycisphaeraceae bacterium]|nr:flagellar hook-associated protein FlgK [Phycisphaeraceae bacterium]